MNDGRDDCDECEAAALTRVVAVRDLLDYVLWGQTNPVGAIDGAIAGLASARGMFMAAGFKAER
jgi:hypothetical protein